MMTTLTIMAMLIGIILGMRFTVLILVPTTLISAATTFGAGMARGDSLWFIVLAVVLSIVALQMGYLAGTIGTVEARVGKISLRLSP